MDQFIDLVCDSIDYKGAATVAPFIIYGDSRVSDLPGNLPSDSILSLEAKSTCTMTQLLP